MFLRRARDKSTAVRFRPALRSRRFHIDAVGKAPVVMPMVFAMNDIAAHTIENIAFSAVCHSVPPFIITCGWLIYYLQNKRRI